MLILLYGPDTWRAIQKLKEIKEQYSRVKRYAFNLKEFDCANLLFENLKSELEALSLFQEKKLLILRNPFLNKELTDSLLQSKHILKESKDIIVFLQEGELPENNTLAQFLLKEAKTQRFPLLGAKELWFWVKKVFRSYHTKITNDALTLFINLIGNNLWQASQEIKKLASFAKSNNSTIKKEDVEILCNENPEVSIFSIIDSAAQRQKKRALSLLSTQLHKGESPFYILSMLNFQFRNLLSLKELLSKKISAKTAAKKLSLHPYLFKKYMSLVHNFTLEELKKIYEKLFEVDFLTKTGQIGPEIALYLFLALL